MAQVGKAQKSTRQVHTLHEGVILEQRDQGKPSEKRHCKKKLNGTGAFPTAIPHCLNGNMQHPFSSKKMG